MDIHLQATGDDDPLELQAVLNNFLAELNMAPEIMYAFSGYSSSTPHHRLQLADARASRL
jgi:hypothetical protein